MSLTKAWSSGGGGSVRQASSGGEVLKTGYIKKLKTMKKKFFVLRAECGDSPSCLEYYDSEKKWKAHQSPKRVITLQSCFNINRRWDLKQRFVVALYTKDDCFCLCLDSEEEAEQWLCVLLSTQRGGEDSAEGDPPRPTFEHVWQVQIQKKGLGSSRNILGPYMLCLTSHSLTLVRSGSTLHPGNVFCTLQDNTANQSENANDTVEFSLSTIRRCGHSDCFFYMEVGRSSITGAGELWMQTEDTYIAQNMHDAILHAMSSSRNGSTSSQKADADLGPHPRTRSSSANEASKPVSVLQRGLSARYASQSSNQSSTNHGPPNVPSPGCVSAPAPSGGTGSRERCDSLPSRARTISEGPPASHPSPPTAAYSSLHQHTLHHHHHPSSSLGSSSSQHVVHRHLGATASRPHSMCTRGLSYSPPIISSPVSPASGACSTTDSAGSSLSMEEGEGWGASNGAMMEGGGEGFAGGSHGSRYGHSLTPDEPAILEENADDEYMPWVPGGAGLDMEDCGDDQRAADDVDGKDYVTRGGTKGATTSLTLPIHPLSLIKPSPRTSQTHQQRVSKSASPSQHGEYMEMHSATSPLESSVGYMPMSPGSGVSSSMEPLGFAAKILQSNMEQKHGYVPMTPGHPPDDGYVDMDPHQNSKDDGNLSSRGEMSPAASSCSVTSGTPSTDTRFSEYHLEKVSSYFTPSEEDDVSHGDDILPMERPVRAYSVGSRPETIRRKNWLEVGNSELVRARAFSVGSQQGGSAEKCLRGKGSPSHHHHQRHPVHVFAPSTAASQRCRGALTPKGSSPKSKKNSKSSSAPHLQALSSSWSGSSTLCSPPASIPSPYSQKSETTSTRQVHANPHLDHQDHDLMELDFSRRSVARVDSSRVGKTPGHPIKKPGDVKEDPPYIPMGAPPQQEMMPSSFSPPLLLSPPSAHGAIGPSSASSASVTLEEYVDMNYSKDCGGSDSGKSNLMSGYMEMHPRKSSLASDGSNPADYVNMGGSMEDSRCKAPEASRPIAIKKERREESVVGMSGKDQGRGSSPNFSFASLLSRKSSTGTPPKGPFSEAVSGSSPFTSLRRGRRKQGAEEVEENECSIHKETSGRGDLPTPTAIFPFSLNSPGSPIRPFPGHYESASKCPVDATSGTVHISYPYVPSSPVATAESVMPIRAKSGRCCECSVPSGGVTSYPPSRREVKNLSDLHPFSKSNSILISNANTSASPPSGSLISDREYANCCPSPPRQSSGKPPVSAPGDYMPMAPTVRSRKTSVVSGPGDYMVMGPSSISSSPDASHLFNAPTMLPSAVQKSSSMDYVCMKAIPSPNTTGSSSPQRTAVMAQKTKSPSPGDVDVRVSTEVSPAKGSSSDDYVEIDMSKKPPVIESKESEAVPSRRTSVPRTVVPSVGAYTPSHTGFGYLFHHSSVSTSSFSSRLPPVPSSYTWPRKGAEVRKTDVASKSKPVDLVSPQNEGKSDDYILMNHDMKPAKSLHPHVSNQVSAGISSLKCESSMLSMKTPPSTTATITATTTTNTNLTTQSHKSITSSIVTIPEAIPTNVMSSTSIPGTVPSSTVISSSSASLDCATPVPSTKIPIFSTAIQTARKTSIKDKIPEFSSINTSGLSTVESSVISKTSPVAVVTTCPMVTSSVKSVISGVTCCDASRTPVSSDFSSITNKTVTTTTAVMPVISSPSVDTIFVSKINPIPIVANMASTSVASVSAVDTSTSSVSCHTSGPITIPARTPSKSHIPPASVSVCASSSTEPSCVKGTDTEIKGKQMIARKNDDDVCQEASVVERDIEKAGDGQVKTACKTTSDAKAEIEKSKCIAASLDDSGTDSLTDSSCSVVVAKQGHNVPSKESHEVSFPENIGSTETSITEVETRAKNGKPGQQQRYDSKRSVSRGSNSRDPCRRNSGESHHRAGEERERLREGGRSARVRRRSSDVAKDTQLGASKLNRTASGRSCCQDVEDDSSLYEKLLAPGSRQQQQRKWQHNSLSEKSSGLGSLRRQMSSPSAVPDPDGVYEKLLPTNSVARRRSGDKAGSIGLSGGEGPTPVFSASSSSASSSSSLASVASSVILGPLRSGITSSPPPLNQQGAAASTGEIHYASLDLAPPVCDSEEQSGRCGRRSPRLFAGRSGAESPSATSVNSNSLVAEQPLNYAEIDFTKSVAVKNRLRH